MREMVLVLANLFGRRYLHEDFINRMKPKSSIVSQSCLHMREKEHRLMPSGETWLFTRSKTIACEP